MTHVWPLDTEAPDAESLERLEKNLEALREASCIECGRGLCGHELLFNVALGLSQAPRCTSCLAAGMAIPAEQMRDHLWAHFRRRPCYGDAWRRESDREGFPPDALPGCLWPRDRSVGVGQEEPSHEPRAAQTGPPSLRAGEEPGGKDPSPSRTRETGGSAGPGDVAAVQTAEEIAACGPGSLQVSGEWDAGELSCGELTLALRLRVSALAPRAILKVVARDLGAIEDIPAWCRLTGHVLLQHRHPEYWIQRKE